MKKLPPFTKSLIAFFSLFLVGQIAVIPCTVAVVSGKATPDGRPLLWKNRDTSMRPNKIAFLQGDRYSFIGIIHPLDKEPKNVWAGINSEGFAIMNSASTDLAEDRLNIPFILQEAARDLVNEKLHSYPLSDPEVFDSATPFYINTSDTINRNSTVSVTLFHGAPSPDKAYLSTMWVLLGQAVCTAAFPLWAHAEGVPEVAGGEGTAPLNDLAIALEDYLYPDERGHMQQYLNVTRLLTYRKKGVLGRIMPIENKALEKTEKKLLEWEKEKPKKEEMAAFQTKVADWVYQSLRESFPDIQPKE